MSDTQITLQDFYEKHLQLGSRDLILDVRRPEEYQESHIENALNIPVDQVGLSVDKLKGYDHVYIHCKKGGRAKVAFETLKSAGLNNVICIFDGGMDAWIEKGYPHIKG